MEEKSFEGMLAKAEGQYFAAADAVLAKHNLAEPSEESFRKFVSSAKKPSKNTSKKAAS